MKNIVAIGGGHGLSAMLLGIKDIENVLGAEDEEDPISDLNIS